MAAEQDLIQIRSGTIQDAASSLVLQKAVVSEMNYLITLPEELTGDLSQYTEWVEKMIDQDRETFIVAEVNGELAGWIVFQSSHRKRLAHTGSLGMMVGAEHRGKGIGKLLLNALLEWAERHEDIKKVSLGVFSDNHRALSLYKKMGFQEEGRKVNEIQRSENEFIDDVLLYKMV
ncbi:GNAT family N-acetyltransferase [Jeotgalibacillus sp. ET6]|uniref:GNAT family N-acetyltransferase n=1 Tax=Jeotgalibacillus sp. ET6 TaxID=3037260 RepID=UPI0024186281|nr:GNAT family N-acetyltransferase [Jeotgalibacillus sp. ET6]MDG5472020.1 GNAT family N-acetyltransferase [Jeotgalibacillus sp. ET6]